MGFPLFILRTKDVNTITFPAYRRTVTSVRQELLKNEPYYAKKLKYSILNIAFDILSWYSICKSFLRMVFYPQGVVWKLAFYKINIRNEWSS